ARRVPQRARVDEHGRTGGELHGERLQRVLVRHRDLPGCAGPVHQHRARAPSLGYRPFITRNAFTVDSWAPNRQTIAHAASPVGRPVAVSFTSGSEILETPTRAHIWCS